MSQNDLTIANQGYPAFRADLNLALKAIDSGQSGAVAPGTTRAYQTWFDTAALLVKQRNSGDTGWIVRGSLSATMVRSATATGTFSIGVKDRDGLIKIDATGNAVTLQLPTASSVVDAGKIDIIRIDSTSNTVKLVTAASNEFINGATSLIISGQYRGASIWAAGNKNFYTNATITAVNVTPIGVMAEWGGTIPGIPSLWLACDGGVKDSIANATLAPLYTAIGNQWGGATASNFKVPDYRGRSPLGVNATGLGNGLATGFSARTLATSGGEETHTQTATELVPHIHTETRLGETAMNPGTNAALQVGRGVTTVNSGSTGGGAAMNTMHPFLVVTKIIRAF